MIQCKHLTAKKLYSLIKPEITKDEFLKVFNYISEELFLLLQDGQMIAPVPELWTHVITKNSNPASFNYRAVDWNESKRTGKRCYHENFADGYRLHLKSALRKNFSNCGDYYPVLKDKYKEVITELATLGDHENFMDVTGVKGQVKASGKLLVSPDRHCREIYKEAGECIGKDYKFVYGLIKSSGRIIRDTMLRGENTSIDWLCFIIKPNSRTVRFRDYDEKYLQGITLKNNNPMALEYDGKVRKFDYKSQALRACLFEPKKFIRLPDYEEKTLKNYLYWQYKNKKDIFYAINYTGLFSILATNDLHDLREDTKLWSKLIFAVLRVVHGEDIPVDIIEHVLINLVSK